MKKEKALALYTLYEVSRNEYDVDCDEYESFVIAATSEAEARYTSPCDSYYYDKLKSVWRNKSDNTIQERDHCWTTDLSTLNIKQICFTSLECKTVISKSFIHG